MNLPLIPETESRIERAAANFRPGAGPNLLLWLILGFFVAFFLWASLTEIDRTVRGVGKIVPSSKTQLVSNLEGGIIEEVLVRTGQLVKAGDPLVRLDPTQTGGELGSGTATVSALAAKVARLEAEVTGRPPAFSGSATDAVEQALYTSRMAELSSLKNAGAARILAATRTVAEAEASYAARRSNAASAQAELDAVRPLVQSGIEPRITLTAAQGRAESSASEAAAALATIARARATVAEARAAAEQQQQDWRSRSANELSVARAEYAARSSGLPALEKRAERTVVTAPVDGRINRVLVSTRGGTVSPGGPLLELVPSADGLLVEALVSPKDIASVRIGQRAKVSLTAYDSGVYGSLVGRVVAISPDAVVNEKTGESHYVVEVRTTRTALSSPSGRPLPIGIGMIADIALLGDKRSVLSYLLTPFTRLKEEAFRE